MNTVMRLDELVCSVLKLFGAVGDAVIVWVDAGADIPAVDVVDPVDEVVAEIDEVLDGVDLVKIAVAVVVVDGMVAENPVVLVAVRVEVAVAVLVSAELTIAEVGLVTLAEGVVMGAEAVDGEVRLADEAEIELVDVAT